MESVCANQVGQAQFAQINVLQDIGEKIAEVVVVQMKKHVIILQEYVTAILDTLDQSAKKSVLQDHTEKIALKLVHVNMATVSTQTEVVSVIQVGGAYTAMFAFVQKINGAKIAETNATASSRTQNRKYPYFLQLFLH